MKKNIFVFIFCLFCSVANAQQYSGDVKVITNGGALVSGSGYSGSATIGLPIVGILSGSNYESKTGVFGDTVRPMSVSFKVDNIQTNIYPNPSTGKFTVIVPNDFVIIKTVSISDEQGSNIETLPFTMKDKTIQFAITGKPNGVYFLRIEGKNSIATCKVTLLK